MRNPVAQIILLLMLLSLAACGFQLRGSYPMPEGMEKTWVDYSGTDTDIRRETVRALNLNGSRIVNSASAASAVLELQRATVRRDILSRDRNGRPQEYAIEITLKFRLADPEGFTLVETREVSSATVLALDTTNPGASRSELDAAVASLREDAVWQMIRTLSAASENAAVE